MSKENVEIVRRFFEAAERFLEAYWEIKPRPLAEAVKADDPDPETKEMWALLHPDAVWVTDGLGTFRGELEIARAWDDILELTDDYAISLGEVVDCGRDRVLATVNRRVTGTGSGISATFPLFVVITVRGGLVAQLDEYPGRDEALEAARLSE
jgi:ketosteroid isomerase-like protein